MPADLPPEPPLAVESWLLPYAARLDARALTDIDLVVIHCTELPDLAQARAFGEKALYASSTGNSGHYYIDRDGRVFQFVPVERIAHHVRGYNERSIGIELVNRGRWPDWFDSRRQTMHEPYPQTQIAALAALLAQLRQRLPNLRHIAGHEWLDREQVPASDDPQLRVARKRDPGPLFPWPAIERDSGLAPLRPE